MLSNQPRLRVLIANGQSLFREAVRAGLESQDDLVVVAEAADGVMAVAQAERSRPDVAIVDAQLSGCNGIQTTYLIKERLPRCKVILLGDVQDEVELIAAVEAGASGYFTKETPLAVVIEAARAVHRGETLIPSRMLGTVLNHLTDRRTEKDAAIRRLSRLTSRERQVLALLSEGAGNEAIADALVISPHTARTHIQNILSKLGMHSRLEAAAFVIQNGLVETLTA